MKATHVSNGTYTAVQGRAQDRDLTVFGPGCGSEGCVVGPNAEGGTDSSLVEFGRCTGSPAGWREVEAFGREAARAFGLRW